MKVWCFNCYGVCVARLEEGRIDDYNARHPLAHEKIVFWKE